jgi:hypothetical protein
MSDYLNSEQRSAVKACAEDGHRWGDNDEESCMCCGWPRAMVADWAGGYKKTDRKDEE